MDAKVDRTRQPRRGKAEPGDRPAPGRQPTRIQAANRTVILDAALEVFSAHGFRGSTLDQIAAAAGMSKPNLLYYFPRKQDIYAAVLEATLDVWLAPLFALDPAGEPIEELGRYVSRKLALSVERPKASRLFAGEILAGAPVIGGFLEDALKRLVDEKAAVIGAWIGDGRLAPVDPYHLIFAIWATTQHYADFAPQIHAILGRKAGGAGFEDEASRAVLAILLNGLRPRP